MLGVALIPSDTFACGSKSGKSCCKKGQKSCSKGEANATPAMQENVAPAPAKVQ